MGINRDLAAHLLKTVKTHGVRGRCLSLGRQSVFLTVSRLLQMMVDLDLVAAVEDGRVTLAEREEIIFRQLAEADMHLSQITAHRDRGMISDSLLFGLAGFDELKNLDINMAEGADFQFDLNGDGILSVIEEPFDFVVDFGTIEHVFHIPNVFRNIFDALKVGGLVMHYSPANNHFDHGFYQFSPTLFNDYYRANNFEIVDLKIFRHTMRGEFNDDDPWMTMEYEPLRFGLNYVGQLDDKVYGVFVIARKTEQSTWDVIPQQGAYRIIWDQTPDPET
jgi:SAM-dependent methyltransferase